jgi:hypothetical protein
MPHALKNIVQLKLPNVVFMNGYPLLVTEYPDLPHRYGGRPSNRTRFCHTQHIDWNYRNFGSNRNSTKGNDRFFRAFIRAVQDGLPVECVVLDRGPDSDVVRDMIEAGGVSHTVTWKPHLTRDELHREMVESDVVVSFFSHGGIGSIAMEAMSMRLPVLHYANRTYFDMMYGGNMPPVVNCRTENEIYEKIKWCCYSGQLRELGERGFEWVQEHVAPENSLTTFLYYYSLLTGDERIEFGPHIGDMEAHVRSVLEGSYDPLAGISKKPTKPLASQDRSGPATPFTSL